MGQQRPKVIGEEEIQEKPKRKEKYEALKPARRSLGEGGKEAEFQVAEPLETVGEGKARDEATTIAIKEAKPKVRPPKKRSQRYLASRALTDRQKFYPLEEALDLVKKTSTVKFDGSVEVHLVIDQKKNEKESLRGLVVLPHGIGKEPRVVILDQKKLEEIAKTKKADFDIALAKPDLMGEVNKIAKILGPLGKMPNPKSGTITEEPAKTLAEIKKGKMEYRSDEYGIVHMMLGKVSWETKKLAENYRALLAVLPAGKLKSIYLSSTMGPSVKVAL